MPHWDNSIYRTQRNWSHRFPPSLGCVDSTAYWQTVHYTEWERFQSLPWSRITLCLSCRRVGAYSARLSSKDPQLEDNRCLICAVMCDEVKADRGTVMNLHEMSCRARWQRWYRPLSTSFTLTACETKHPLVPVAISGLDLLLLICCEIHLTDFICEAKVKICFELIRGFSGDHLEKILLIGFLPSCSFSDVFFFLMGLVQTLQGAAMSQQPTLKRPQQIAAQGEEERGIGGGAIRELQSVKDKRAGVFKRTAPSPVTAQHRVHQSKQHSF